MAIHVCYRSKMVELADVLIEKLKATWNDPFEAPVVIFPNNKTEQWFKQYCVRRSRVIANLDCRRMDAFIMDYLREGYRRLEGNENLVVQELKPEILAHAIVAFLKKGEMHNLLRKDFEPIAKYCLSKEGKLDERKLFDFAIRLSSLYLEYELSRPQKGLLYETGDAIGFLEAWKKKDPTFFAECDREKEIWQHRLYAEVLQTDENGRSFLDNAFAEYEKNRPEPDGKTVFLTLPYLYQKLEESEAASTAISGKKVFVFGVAGMGQYYYAVLLQFAKQNEVYAYIPNPCMQFWEDIQSVSKTASSFESAEAAEQADLKSLEHVKYENALLQKWGLYGRDTVRMWNLIDDDQSGYEGDGEEKTPEDVAQMNLLQKVQYLISQRENILPEEAQNVAANDPSLVVCSAPSRLREVEALHTAVCERVKAGAKLSDMLVASPKMSDYTTEIHQVFDIPEKDDNVHIPYRLIDPNPKQSFVAGVLRKLFEIAAKKDFSRADFFDLISNPVVQAVRGIDAADVRAFVSWTSEMGVYRDGTQATVERHDWAKAVKRLLLARLSTSAFEDPALKTVGCDEAGRITATPYSITPYEDMASADGEVLFKFISLVDDLSAWLAFTSKPYTKNHFESKGGDFSDLKLHLQKWAWMSEPPKNLQGERYVYSQAVRMLERLKFEFFGGLEEVSMQVIERVLLSGAEATEYSRGEVFVGGLTFMNFNPSCVLPAKHIFFLGADSRNFPGERKEDSLDLRTHQFWLGDATTVSRNKYGFLSLLMNAQESFVISYVNKDLQKDEDFYVTSVVNDLRTFVTQALCAKEDSLKEVKVTLDEKRARNELYTSRAIRNYNLYQKLMLQESNEEPKTLAWKYERELPKRVTLSNFKRFLEEPCKFQIERHLSRSEENETNAELEPISFDALARSNVLKRTVQALAQGEIKNEFSSLYTFLQKNFSIPDGLYGKKAVEAIQSVLAGLKSSIGDFENIEANECCSIDFGEWKLEGTLEWRLKSAGDDPITFIAFASKDSAEKFLPLYLSALAYTASHMDSDKPYTVNLNLYDKEKGCLLKKTATLEVTGNDAKTILREIFNLAYKKNFAKAIPLSSIKEQTENFDWDKYLTAIKNAWGYFDIGDLFEIEDICGFVKESFIRDWTDEINLLLPLAKFKIVKNTPAKEPKATKKGQKDGK